MFLDVVPWRQCINIQGKTKITVFLVFNENNFRTSYVRLFFGNKNITEFDDKPPYGSQGDLDNGYGINSFFEMFKAYSIQVLNMSIGHALNGTSMEGMFSGASYFRGDSNISFWVTKNIVNMSRMFEPSMLFNVNINGWDVDEVENMSAMFENAVEFNQPLDDWRVINVRNMSRMFSNAAMFNGYIHNWKVGKVVNMSYVFKNASVFNWPLKKWEVVNVKYMWEMFNGAAFYSHDLSAWKVSKNLDLNVIYKANMFHLSRLENRPDFQPRNQPQPAQSSNLN